MSKNSDFLSTLRSFTNNVQLGNKSASEVADSLNAWLKEGGDALKVKIEDEVERSVSKMGFVKRGEFEALKQEVASLKKGSPKKVAKKSAVKSAVKKTAKKAAKKKVAK
jgi:BMFP domain-containing protein YqiC